MSDDGEGVEEWSLTFHGNSYIINLLCNDVLMTLEVEDEDTCERWSGEFTAQYIEETTHKAGSFKKFGIFTKMLSSAFSKTNESVFVDLLTLADLEMLKARKTGGSMSHSQTHSQSHSSKRQMKRYLILTYTGEFDRVHYPLPLAFEEVPNAVALQRTIRRLRKRLREREDAANDSGGPAGEKEKELRQQMTQLRQENTELKHRLRQYTSRSARGGERDGESVAASAQANADLSSANSKLKRQVEELKREAQAAAVEAERAKREAAKEIAKWKKRGLTGHTDTQGTIGEREREREADELRRRVTALERELRLERLSKGVPSRGHTHSHSHSGDWNASVSLHSLSTRNTGVPPRSVSAGTRSRSLSATATRTVSRERERPRSASPLLPDKRTHSNPKGRTNAGTRSMPSSPGNSRSNSPSLSQGNGKRFDPTAYTVQRTQQHFDALLKTSKPWGAGPGNVTAASQRYAKHRYDSPGDSGYSSAHSQSSQGSRRSHRSASSVGSSSTTGGTSKPKKTKKKKASSHVSGNTKKTLSPSQSATAAILNERERERDTKRSSSAGKKTNRASARLEDDFESEQREREKRASKTNHKVSPSLSESSNASSRPVIRRPSKYIEPANLLHTLDDANSEDAPRGRRGTAVEDEEVSVADSLSVREREKKHSLPPRPSVSVPSSSSARERDTVSVGSAASQSLSHSQSKALRAMTEGDSEDESVSQQVMARHKAVVDASEALLRSKQRAVSRDAPTQDALLRASSHSVMSASVAEKENEFSQSQLDVSQASALEQDYSDIDKRIQALQSYLDNARVAVNKGDGSTKSKK